MPFHRSRARCLGALFSGVLALAGWPGSSHAGAKLEPGALVSEAEAVALLGGDVTLEIHDMAAIYPGSLDFAYQTKTVRILSAAFYPQGGPEMFAKMKQDLTATHRKLVPCAAGDACFMVGEMLHATKGSWYFTIAAGRENGDKMEGLARKVVQRLP